MDDPDAEKEKPVRALDEDDIALLKTYGLGPYASRIKSAEQGIKDVAKRVNDICGIKESDTGLSAPSRWDLVSDKQAQQEEQPLQACPPSPPSHTSGVPLHVVSPQCESSSSSQLSLSLRKLQTSRGCERMLTGGSLHKDHQPRHRGCEICDQRQADCQGSPPASHRLPVNGQITEDT